MCHTHRISVALPVAQKNFTLGIIDRHQCPALRHRIDIVPHTVRIYRIGLHDPVAVHLHFLHEKKGHQLRRALFIDHRKTDHIAVQIGEIPVDPSIRQLLCHKPFNGGGVVYINLRHLRSVHMHICVQIRRDLIMQIALVGEVHEYDLRQRLSVVKRSRHHIIFIQACNAQILLHTCLIPLEICRPGAVSLDQERTDRVQNIIPGAHRIAAFQNAQNAFRICLLFLCQVDGLENDLLFHQVISHGKEKHLLFKQIQLHEHRRIHAKQLPRFNIDDRRSAAVTGQLLQKLPFPHRILKILLRKIHQKPGDPPVAPVAHIDIRHRLSHLIHIAVFPAVQGRQIQVIAPQLRAFFPAGKHLLLLLLDHPSGLIAALFREQHLGLKKFQRNIPVVHLHQTIQQPAGLRHPRSCADPLEAEVLIVFHQLHREPLLLPLTLQCPSPGPVPDYRDRYPDPAVVRHKYDGAVVVSAVQLLVIHIIIKPVYIAEKRRIRHVIFLHPQKTALRLHPKMRVSPPVAVHHKRIAHRLEGVFYPDLRLLRQIFHRSLLVDLQQKFLYVMLIVPHCGKSQICGIMLLVVSFENAGKLLGIKQPDSLLPAAPGQIGKMKQVLDIAQTGNDRLRSDRHRKRNIILSLIRDDIESPLHFLPGFHPTGIEPVQDLVLRTAKPARDALHTQIGGHRVPLCHLPVRAIYGKAVLRHRISLHLQHNPLTGEFQCAVFMIKFAV